MLDFLPIIFSFFQIISFPIWEMCLFICNDNHEIETLVNVMNFNCVVFSLFFSFKVF